MSFATLTPADDATLHWRQPEAMKRDFVLTAGERTFARLTWHSWAGSTARAEAPGGTWELAQEGSWRPRIIARAGDAVIATLDIKNAWMLNRADLVMADGSVIARWELASFLSGTAVWQAPDEAPLISFRSGTDEGGMASWLRTQCRVDFTPAGFDHPHRDLLLCVGWYMALLAADPA